VGFLKKLRNAVGGVVSKLPGGSQIQKVVGKDPIAQSIMKVDPLARDMAGAAGLIAPGQAADPAQAPVRTGFQPPTSRNAGWQGERVAALRARFARPGAAPVGAAPVGVAPVAAAPVSATPPPVATGAGVTAAPAISPPSVAAPASVPMNPAQQDIDTYSYAWDRANNTY